MASGDAAYVTLCIETNSTKVADEEDCTYALLVMVQIGIADQVPNEVYFGIWVHGAIRRAKN